MKCLFFLFLLLPACNTLHKALGNHEPSGSATAYKTVKAVIAGTKVKWPTQWAEYDKDILPVKEIKNTSCYAMVLPDGRWAERGKMGWFGTATDEAPKEKWLEFVEKTLKEHQDKMAVVVDCHI